VVQAALGPHGENGQPTFTCVDFGKQGSPLSFRSAYADAVHLERCLSEDGKLQEIQVDVVSLDRLLEGVTAQVDLLVLDIEGHELNVLKWFSLKTLGPRVLMIEIHFGSDDDELRSYLGTQGYASAGIIGCNELFATENEVQRLTNLVRAFLAGDLQGC
jgi:FkbM family methyltransferase